MILLQLFWAFFQTGLFSIGGGYAAMPMIHHQAVELYSWLTTQQFSDLLAISEMTPGPISLNAATFVGFRMMGVPGALSATFGCILPSCIITITLAKVYYRFRSSPYLAGTLNGLRTGVAAAITSAAITVAAAASIPADAVQTVIFAVSFFLLRKFHINPVGIIALSAVSGAVIKSILP